MWSSKSEIQINQYIYSDCDARCVSLILSAGLVIYLGALGVLLFGYTIFTFKSVILKPLFKLTELKKLVSDIYLNNI